MTNQPIPHPSGDQALLAVAETLSDVAMDGQFAVVEFTEAEIGKGLNYVLSEAGKEFDEDQIALMKGTPKAGKVRAITLKDIALAKGLACSDLDRQTHTEFCNSFPEIEIG